MKKIIFALLVLNSAAFAGDGDKVTRTEGTGTSRVMAVGSCVLTSNTNFEGKVVYGYQLTFTKCIEYKTFEAIQHGSGWNADFEEVAGTARLFNKMQIETQSFNNYNSSDEIFDQAMSNLALLSQCTNTANTLRQVTDSRACQ
jgi:hypothetical protein